MAGEFEEQYMDVLQNIEVGLLSSVKSHPELCDHDMLRIVEHLIMHYKSQQKERSTSGPNQLTGIHQEIFQFVLFICDSRIGIASSPNDEISFDLITKEELLLCLKRIEKSIKFWTKGGGRKGYIEFVAPRVLLHL